MIRRLIQSEGGTSLIEFALALPLLLLLFLGGVQLSDALACKRKVVRATRLIADLASQSALQTAADVDDLFVAARQIVAPYPLGQAQMRVSQLRTDAFGSTTVVWSRGSGLTPRVKGTSYDAGAAVSADSYAVMSEFSYTYTPVSNFAGIPTITFSDRMLMSPRRSDQVTCNDC